MTNEREWAEEQMKAYGLTSEQSSAVRNLLDTYWTARSMGKMSDADLKTILIVFSNLATGVALTEPEDPDEVWISVKPGMLTLRDTVRVKADAYTGNAGLEHNGRTGVVVGIRPDDIRVKYTDERGSVTDWTGHRTFALEKRVR